MVGFRLSIIWEIARQSEFPPPGQGPGLAPRAPCHRSRTQTATTAFLPSAVVGQRRWQIPVRTFRTELHDALSDLGVSHGRRNSCSGSGSTALLGTRQMASSFHQAWGLSSHSEDHQSSLLRRVPGCALGRLCRPHRSPPLLGGGYNCGPTSTAQFPFALWRFSWCWLSRLLGNCPSFALRFGYRLPASRTHLPGLALCGCFWGGGGRRASGARRRGGEG